MHQILEFPVLLTNTDGCKVAIVRMCSLNWPIVLASLKLLQLGYTFTNSLSEVLFLVPSLVT